MANYTRNALRVGTLLRFLVLCTSLTLVATSCVTLPRAPKKVRIGYEAILSDYTYFVAHKNGYFEREGLQVEVTQFNTTNEQTLALLAGKVDMIPNSSLALLLAAEVEQPGRFQVFMAHGDLGNKVLVRGDSPVTSVKELSGAKIGINPGTTMRTYATLALAPYFGNAKPPMFIEMPPPSLPAALAARQVDAIFPVEPIVTIALQKGGAREILNNPLGNIMTPFTGGASVLRAGFVKENPASAAAVVRAMESAAEYIRTHDAESRAILATYTGFSGELLQTSTLGYLWKLNEIDRHAIATLSDILATAGVVERKVDTSEWYYHGGE